MPGYELVGKEELQSIQGIFEHSNGVLFAHGFDARRNHIFRVRDFEKAVAVRFGAKHCLAVSSGTAAQFVALKALGIGPGDEVITQAFTFVATVEAIIECGATPVVVDIDETLNMNPVALADAISPRTKCIVPVHMLGNPARMEEILAIARARNIPVVEDACEALGAIYRGKPVGTLGDIGFFSLDFGKTITSGEGGLILTNNSNLHQFMVAYHDHGHQSQPGISRAKETAEFSGFNLRMTEMQAAVGQAQLAKLDFILGRNRRNKTRLKLTLQDALKDRIAFRQITDPNGDLCDTLMFFLPDAAIAQQVAARLLQAGVDTKNVPSAMGWHYAGCWPHIWKNQSRYADSHQTAWAKSAGYLERSIALPILVLSTEADLDGLAAKTIQAVKECT